MDRLVDYFAVCGLPATAELQDSSRALEAERARDVMDIAIVFGNEEPPDGHMTIMHTPNGNVARFDQMQMSGLESRNSNVYLTYRRRDRDEHGPAISSIEVGCGTSSLNFVSRLSRVSLSLPLPSIVSLTLTLLLSIW